MTRSFDPKDPATLLCERCGYVIDGLEESGNCPECGKPIAESLPERRTGSAWQREGTFRSALQTHLWVLRHPVTCWDRIRVEGYFGKEQLGHTLIQAATLGVIPLILFAVFGYGQLSGSGRKTSFDTVISVFNLTVLFCVQWVGVVGIGWALSWIEMRGIRFFGARHGWRVSDAVAATICGHASVGWMLAFGGVHMSITVIAIGFHSFGRMPNRLIQLVLLSVPASFFLGMLLFETLVYLGVRRMRFANQPRAPVASAPAPEGLERPASPT